MEITDLTPAERRVVEAFPRGEGVDFLESADEDPGSGAGWGAERTVRAEVLRALLVDGPRRDGEIAGLKLSGARITGVLNLRYGTINCPVRLRACYFEEPPDLYGAQIRALVLSDSLLPGLTAGTLHVDLVLRMSRCRITGPVRLAGARIGGAVFLDGARLDAGGGDQDPTAPVLSIDHATIGADLWAVGLVVRGETGLNGAAVGGQINLDDATLHTPGGTALYAENLSVGADLRAMRLRADGRINLTGATVPGQLNLAYARLSNPGGQALRASSCVAGELWLRDAAPIEGAVNLRRSQLELLHISPEVWPDQVMIDGLGYRRLAPHLPAEQRLPLLEREQAGYQPFTYEQLATAYRAAGDEAAARTVQFAKLRRHRRTLPWHARIWGRLQDVTVGYGFRPLRAAGWLAALLLTGTVAFALHHPPALKPGEAPEFNPAFYTLDLLLPIIGFGQETAYAPQGAYQWLAYLLIIGGWVLATTIAAGVTRSLSRQ
ncbi:membrane-associated oxidoreductase [Streptomyces pristinaespiralis]|uniref:membrane-associated oxidoreductase n=1 Tax=Streptomyces pristinaespiralis TaxID=38300 RepID=UPI0033DE86C0